MTRLKTLAVMSFAVVSLAACMSERSMDADSTDGIFLIQHSGPGTVYWQ